MKEFAGFILFPLAVAAISLVVLFLAIAVLSTMLVGCQAETGISPVAGISPVDGGSSTFTLPDGRQFMCGYDSVTNCYVCWEIGGRTGTYVSPWNGRTYQPQP